MYCFEYCREIVELCWSFLYYDGCVLIDSYLVYFFCVLKVGILVGVYCLRSGRF